MQKWAIPVSPALLAKLHLWRRPTVSTKPPRLIAPAWKPTPTQLLATRPVIPASPALLIIDISSFPAEGSTCSDEERARASAASAAALNWFMCFNKKKLEKSSSSVPPGGLHLSHKISRQSENNTGLLRSCAAATKLPRETHAQETNSTGVCIWGRE